MSDSSSAAVAASSSDGSRQGTNGSETEHGGEAEQLLPVAAIRSSAYLIFREAIRFPDAENRAWIAGGGVLTTLRQYLPLIDPELNFSEQEWQTLAPGPSEEIDVEYSRLFDVSGADPKSSLCGGAYGPSRMQTMEETVRFYHHFGLKLSQTERELPDHLETELEFLHFLTHHEAEARVGAVDPLPLAHAQRDFIKRHPAAWLPKLCARSRELDAHPYYQNLFQMLERLVASELARLERNHPVAH